MKITFIQIYMTKTTFPKIKENDFKQLSLFLFVPHVLSFGLFVVGRHVFNCSYVLFVNICIDLT